MSLLSIPEPRIRKKDPSSNISFLGANSNLVVRAWAGRDSQKRTLFSDETSDEFLRRCSFSCLGGAAFRSHLPVISRNWVPKKWRRPSVSYKPPSPSKLSEPLRRSTIAAKKPWKASYASPEARGHSRSRRSRLGQAGQKCAGRRARRHHRFWMEWRVRVGTTTSTK